MMFAGRRCEIDFHRPAHLDDLVEVRSRLTALSGARLNAVQEIWRAGEQLARLVVEVASLRGDGRPTRIPAPVRDALEPFVQPLEQRQPMAQDAVNSILLDGSVDPAIPVWGAFLGAGHVGQVGMLLLVSA